MKRLLPIFLCLSACMPNLRTPDELAGWSKCKPYNIGAYICQTTDYPEKDISVDRHVTGNLENVANCRGRARMAQEALEVCGYEARVVSLRQKNGPGHAIATFTDKSTGRRGFVNCNQVNTYKAGTEWKKIIEDVRGGPWREYK